MAVTYDLPATFQNEATLLDSNAGFFLQDNEIPNSKVFVEKYVTKKQDYQFLPIGTPSEFHPSARLYAEEDFTDIGGGLMTFNRKYAQIPDTVAKPMSVQIRTGNLYGFAGVDNNQADFIGGELDDGENYVQNDRVFARNSTMQLVIATVARSFLIADDVNFDETTEILNVKKSSSISRTITYYDVTIDYTIGGDPVITRTPVSKSYTSRGATFAAGTVFRREVVGRYLGDIYEIKEYALYNDVTTSYGKLVNGSAQTVNITF